MNRNDFQRSSFSIPLPVARRLFVFALSFSAMYLPASCSTSAEATRTTDKKPNIVFCMADDWSWPHAGILGDPVVKTPHFDRVAREGVLFSNAFVSTPSCTPSRLSILTGQHHWRLKEGDSLGGSLREEFPVYTDLLQDAGYRIGRFGKGVWPSKHTFRMRDSFGERYKSFEQFLADRKPSEPFCYWHGGQDPHRPYELGIGKRSGFDLTKVKLPGCLPDNDIVRGDVADYLWEVERFDREVGGVIKKLENIGELENTIIVVSGDNGMPFPRCKATLYDQGTRVPLAVRWGAEVSGERVVDDFVNLCDLAPSFLDASGLKVPEQMTGKSLLPILLSDKSGIVESDRDFELTGVEKHVYPYPKRALRTADFLYIRNIKPNTWKTVEVGDGNAKYDFATTSWPTDKGAFSYAIDPSPTKQFLRLHRNDPDVKRFAELCFAPRPKEELYDLSKDPEQLNNVADQPKYLKTLKRLRQKLEKELIKSDDPQFTNADPRKSKVERTAYRVEKPPTEMQLSPFYTKYVDASGYPIVSSEKVNDFALKEAAYLIDMMLAERPDVRKAMVASGSRMIVMSHDEFTTDIPEYAKMRPKNYWDARARGLGGSRSEAVCSCAEENVLSYKGDPYSTENILIHEFAHNIHLRGMMNLDPKFNDRLKETYDHAMAAGLWKSKYASTNHAEYFAEGVQSWFNNNREPDHDHNHVNTRKELKEYDPGLAAICEEVFGKTELVYTKPATRLEAHLEGYDPATAPRFAWPDRLNAAKKKIREDVKKRDTDPRKEYKN